MISGGKQKYGEGKELLVASCGRKESGESAGCKDCKARILFYAMTAMDPDHCSLAQSHRIYNPHGELYVNLGDDDVAK